MVEKKKTKTVKSTKTPKEDGALTREALESKLIDLKKNAMNLRFTHAAGQLPKTHEIRKTRREIARTKTALGKK